MTRQPNGIVLSGNTESKHCRAAILRMWRFVGVVVVLAGLSPSTSMAADLKNSAELAAALAAARGGETITLANGSYGDLSISQAYASNVTIQAATEHKASFGIFKITGSNVTVDGLSI
ncbi:MAG: hypothetical protein WBB25_22795, partial [Sulfitobacter sp.]